MSVTTLPRHDAPAPSSSSPRWRPQRAGIVNVWRYYDEQFTFHRGRLLLRGPNGTGKSKALELLLPYLLDANLRPSRLSTFGGQERTMHWNLMGDGYDGKNRVGYVWAEFRHDATDAWFTIGARLQASTNTRSVTATYFTTAQRVGVEGSLALIGEGNRPLTAADLAVAIGDHGAVHPNAGAYRQAVTHALFPRFDAQQYEALITALLQLRTPKLSEHLDPGELSALLSGSLPPLDAQSVAEIAEGFEKLDRRREDIAALERDVDAARRLADRQRRYAQRVVRAAAEALKRATNRMDDLTRKARESAEQHEVAEQSKATLEDDDRRLDEEAMLKTERAKALRQSDAYRTHAQLAELREHHSQLQDRARHEQRRARDGRHDESRDRAALESAQAEAQRLADHAERAAAEAERAAGRAGLAAVLDESTTRDVEQARQLTTAAIEARDDQVAQVRRALAHHSAATSARDRAATRLDTVRAERDDAEMTAAQCRGEYSEAVDRLSIALHDWATQCEQLTLDASVLDRLAGDEAAVLAMVSQAAAEVERSLAHDDAQLRTREAALGEQRREVADQRAELAAQQVLNPPAPRTRTAEREGRPGAPLWKLVRFRGALDVADQAAVEAALEDSGLLDAWVRPDGRVEHDDGHDRFTDATLGLPAPGASLADVLEPEADTLVPADRVTALLRTVAYGPLVSDHPAVVGRNGSWRLSNLTGSWSKPEPDFIGAVARERARQRRLAELDRQLAELDRLLADVAGDRDVMRSRRARLVAEQQDRPPHAPVQEAAERLATAQATLRARADAVAKSESELREADGEVTTTLRSLAQLASEHQLPTEAGVLDEVVATLRTFRTACATWLDARVVLDTAQARRDDAEKAWQRSQQRATVAEAAAEEADRQARSAGIRLRTLEERAGETVTRTLEELHGLDQRLDGITAERRALAKRLREVEHRIGTLAERMQTDENARQDATDARDHAGAALRHLGVNGIAVDARVDIDVAALDGVKPTLEAARRISEELAAQGYEPKQLQEAASRVSEVVHEVRQTLAGRADVTVETDDAGVALLVAAVDGQRVGASGLHARLTEELQHARAELTDSEDRLFDQTLAGEARRQVADRIRQANELVDEMNGLLQRVQTASKMRVRLKWQIDGELPAGTREARDLILRSPESLSAADRAALHAFFRDRVEEIRQADTAAGWQEQLLDVLDYRSWHTFEVQIDKGDGAWQAVTKRTHGQLSGGERAIALHLPLFAAAAAHYAGAEGPPRLILLDEVFVGVDADNRGQLLDLIVRLDLDAVMTSDHEWCTYTELDGIAVHQLITGTDGDDAVTTARFVWDGSRLQPAQVEELTLGLEDDDA